jgi:dynein heavy chain
MMRSSVAAAALCTWVKAIEEYAQALKVVNPKKAKMEAAMAKVAAMVEALQELEDKYASMTKRLAEQEAEL